MIADSKLNHTGRYILNAESPAGHKVLKVRVNVLGEWVPHSYLHLFKLSLQTISSSYLFKLPRQINELNIFLNQQSLRVVT